MLDYSAWLLSLITVLSVSVVAWVFSVARRDVSIVDSLWSLMILLGLLAYLAYAAVNGPRTVLLVTLLAIWAARLSLHITVRNHGEPEDRRYQAIRANNQPFFEWKSLYIIFLFQGFLAWLICLPVVAAVSGQAPTGPLDYAGAALWLAGMFFEVVGDYQLLRFRKARTSGAEVLNTGLWRYSRHPNYFGEAMLWWGFYLFALSAGAWWTVVSPLLMTFLLLRVSGVALLEKDISERRPAYRDYISRTNAFIPGRPRKAVSSVAVMLLLIFAPVTADEGLAPAAAGNSWKFRVYLDEKEIGYHHFYLAQFGETSQLKSIASFEYKLMFVRLFHYEHENSETWSGDCLQSISSRTDANGEPFQVNGRREPGEFRVAGSEGEVSLPECVMSFAYWNPAFLEQSTLLNTQSGEFQQVDISLPVFEELEIRGEPRPSYRYRLAAGALNLDLWYSTDREWLALESEVRGGRTLRYELDQTGS